MATAFPPDLEQFIRQELASGKYQSEDELVHQALRVFQEIEVRRHELRDHARVGIDQLDRGEGIRFESDNSLRQFFDDLQNRGRAQYEASRQGEQ